VCRCPTGQLWELGTWSDWINGDTPEGWGDAEGLHAVGNPIGSITCGTGKLAVRTNCVVANNEYNWDTVGYLIGFSENGECKCSNEFNPSGCIDLKVRFKCPHSTLGHCECTFGRIWNATANACQCPSNRGFVWNPALNKCICSAGRTPNTAG
jgi:hypothetical protein